MAQPLVAGILALMKTLVVIVVWNRFENLNRWLHCWDQCEKSGAELVVIHNLEHNNQRYESICAEHGVRIVNRPNVGFDIGAFQDVCKERLAGFPNDWDNLIWLADDCIPMSKDFVTMYLERFNRGIYPCYEISGECKMHLRTTGFFITKSMSRRLTWPCDPIVSLDSCYQFEHRGFNLLQQMQRMKVTPVMVTGLLEQSPLWDTGSRGYLQLMAQHEQVFSKPPEWPKPKNQSLGMLDDLAIKHQADKGSRYHNFAVKYDKLFSGMRESVKKLLEVGVGHGQSLKMWVDYFPNATIYGADIEPSFRSCESYSPRISFHCIDQRSVPQLKALGQFAPFDIIIDDGNHWWKEQILTFQTLFQFLRSGGIYVVEDTCTSYWKEYKNSPISCVDYFKGLVDEVNLNGRRGSVPINPPAEFGGWEKGWHRREDCHSVPDFESIHFFNAIIAVYRR